MANRWWCRWYTPDPPAFEYHGPWWESGWTESAAVLVAAVVADSEDGARRVIEQAHDNGAAGIAEWSFVNPRAGDWEPFCDRFPRAPWMKWPWPE
jgi:hypothetical protein